MGCLIMYELAKGDLMARAADRVQGSGFQGSGFQGSDRVQGLPAALAHNAFVGL
jgi:hypothetical protein